MNQLSARAIATPLIGFVILISYFLSASAGAQGFFDRVRGLLGGETTEKTSEAAQDTSLTEDDIGAGLKEALQVAVETVVKQLGASDGFNADPAIHIPLPDSLASVQAMLEKVGLGSLLDNLELRLNQAAETAVPRARELFVQAIDNMTLEDVIGIYRGPDDAATRYFQQVMSEPLAADMRPVVAESLEDVGAAQALDRIMDRYNALPFAREVDSDLTGYVVDKGTEGIFHYLAQEEAAIRRNPVKRTTELLQRVFGN